MRIPIPEKKILTYQMTMPVCWGDLDLMGHVNNTAYFRYMESVRIHWLENIGVQVNPSAPTVVLANTFCNFIREVNYPASLLLNHYLNSIGNSSFDVYVTIANEENPDMLYAAGGATTVWVDRNLGKARPLPQWLRQRLEAYLVNT